MHSPSGPSPWAWPQPATCSSLNTSPTPYEPRPGQFEASFHAGSLAFSDEALSPLLARATAGPTVFIVYLDRPAVLPELDAAVAGLVVDFGASDGAVLDVVFGRVPSRGRLPFDLPSSMAAVEASPSDVAFSTANPLYRFGHGL